MFHAAPADLGDNRKRTTQHATEPNRTGILPAGYLILQLDGGKMA